MKAIVGFLKRSAFIAVAALALVPVASARRVFIGGGIGFGPAYYGYWGPGPYWGPYGYAYAPVPNAGTIKIYTKMKDAAVYVDGAFAGPVTQMKSFLLPPGLHNIQLRDQAGDKLYQDNVAVIAGKTVHLHV